MRESVMWASEGGPIIGQIRHGKKYPFGTVPAAEYEADMDQLQDRITDLNTAVTVVQGSVASVETGLSTLSTQVNTAIPALQQSVTALQTSISDVSASLETLAGKYDAVVPGLAATVTALRNDLTALQTSVTALSGSLNALDLKESTDVQAIGVTLDSLNSGLVSVNNLISGLRSEITTLSSTVGTVRSDMTALSQKEETDIASVNSAVGTVSASVTQLTDVVSGHSASIAGHTSSIAALQSATDNASAAIIAVNSAITDVNAALAELARTHAVDKANLQAAIDALSTSLTALRETVTANYTVTTQRLAELSQSITDNTQNIAVMQSTLTNQGAAISGIQSAVHDVESRMSTEEVGMATLRQQLLNSVYTIENEIEQIVTDKAAIKASVAELNTNLSAYESDTDQTLRELNNRVAALEENTPLEIISFTASPDLCETGGQENVVLTWNVQGNIETITIDGQPVSGNTKTIPNVRENTSFLLNVIDKKGNTARKTVTVKFVNHVYYGTSSNPTADEGTAKALDFTELSDERVRTMHVTPQNEYVYYAYPKRLGTSEFKVNGFTGGFEDPVTDSLDNHSGYEEDYYIYRSANKLNTTLDIQVI